jgi:hypothetical protein
MPDEALILKRNPDALYTESYNVLFEGMDGPQYGHVQPWKLQKQESRRRAEKIRRGVAVRRGSG